MIVEARKRSVVALVLVLLSVGPLVATDLVIGTWVAQPDPEHPTSGPPLTMTIEASGKSGRKITYRVAGPNGADVVSTIDSPMDGTDAPLLLNGKPTGQTMGIKRVDDHHAVTVLKVDGKQFGVSRASLSEDGKTLMVENEITSTEGGHQPGKSSQTWVRK
jgi:hypothetical protein